MISSCSQRQKNTVQGYVDGEFIYLAPNFPGNLTELNVERGGQVAKGEQLFKLDQMPELQELQQAQDTVSSAQQKLEDLMRGQRKTVLEGIIAQEKQARADYIFAQQTLWRDQYLYKKGAIGKAKLDDSTSKYRSALQKVNELKANLNEAKLGARVHQIMEQQAIVESNQAKAKQLQWKLEQKTQFAPLNARVFDTFFKEGEYIPSGQPVLALLAAKDIQLIFYLPEPLLSKMRVGHVVSFNCDSCKTKTNATVYYIAPRAEYTPPVIYSQETRHKLMYRIEAHIKPTEAVNYNPGQPVTVYLNFNSEKK